MDLCLVLSGIRLADLAQNVYEVIYNLNIWTKKR
nr:MAG TPA: hypothetical protein [Caudoviricetes sp.]